MPRTVRRILTLAAALAAALTLYVAPSASAATFLTHSQATSQLSAAGIGWTSSGGCSDRNTSTCTSFEQVRQTTISGIRTLKSASGCAITITGGTETGHSSGTYSHWNGYKLDISKTTCVGKYIKNNFTYLGYVSGWGYQYKSGSGNLYTDEGNHWDILYYNCGGC
ncbi:hypothetical protein J2S40_002636 [Nocardioides luteus]|uniref:Peptidase M15B domain-containing protein n=1 Tax=Nocardioides luteus TaxID=1844 RepID=A0ABQ5T168_9ACTN|nr:hypothetical protein [Nocardioides luteus]MDR7311578.1 hypothetical protein [Nocardioides luteus]GGR54647.1 hypothetical protein GCM10010197_21450 [Nocardioides luteus]GLJ70227.1 hypothetical protein GCM10017579_42630 [Nocardioides luteus]